MRDIKIRVLFVTHNSEFKKEIKEHYTTVDRLMNGDDSFDYITGPEIIAKRQFTGAFDSYSNEMYEDDICMVEVLGCCRVSICSFYGVIFHSKDNIEWGIMDCLSEGYGFKVIGNIHQNPELLETK